MIAEKAVNRLNKLSIQKIKLNILMPRTQCILNMKTQSTKAFLLEDNWRKVDVYQPRESLRGYSLASILVKSLNYFKHLMGNGIHRSASMTLINQFSKQTDHEVTKLLEDYEKMNYLTI